MIRRTSLARPAGIEEPEICDCGHYAYVHGLGSCGGWAHPDHCWQGRVSWGLFGMRFHVSLRCPCDKGWVAGELRGPRWYM